MRISLSAIAHVSTPVFVARQSTRCASLLRSTQQFNLLGFFFSLWLPLRKRRHNLFQLVESRLLGFYWLWSPLSLSFFSEEEIGECWTLNSCKAVYDLRGGGSFYLPPVKAPSWSLLSLPAWLANSAHPSGLRLEAVSPANSCLTHLCFPGA